jgi:hypothetical protein
MSHFRSVIDPRSERRIEYLRELNIARAFMLSEQWLALEGAVASTDGRIFASRYTRQDPRAKIPRPVENETLPLVDNEIAKQARRRSTARVRTVAFQEGTLGSGGREVAQGILDWHLEAINWSGRRVAGLRHEVLYGTMYIWSYLDQSFLKTVRVGITDARRCTHGCDFVLASPAIPEKAAMRDGYNLNDPSRVKRAVGTDESGLPTVDYTARTCLACGGPLEEFAPMGDMLESPDAFGRDLYEEVPLNQPDIEMPPPHEVYPDNDGAGYELFRDVPRWYRAAPRDLDWIKSHYAHIPEVAKLKADPVEEISRFTPVDGIYGYNGTVRGSKMWRNHAVVYTAVCNPYLDWEDGRFVEAVGSERGPITLRDEPLFRPSKRKKGLQIPLVKIAGARLIVKDGEIQGQGIVRPNISPQNRVNMCFSQIVDTRQRGGVDGLLVPDDMQLTSGMFYGFTGRVVRFRPSVSNPQYVPAFLRAHTMDQGVYQEIDRTIDRMQNRVGAQDADVGKAPRNVSAASAIQLLLEQVAVRRELREQEVTEAFREVFSHQLLLLAEFAIEPRQYRTEVQKGKWEYKTFSGQDLEGHTDVVVEEAAGYDAQAFEREAMIQALQMGVVQPTTPYSRREVLRVLGTSTRPLDEENVQISDAESKWYAFRDNQIIPVIDPDLDDHYLMFMVYGRFLKSNEGVQMAQEANWPQILTVISGWEDKLSKARQLDQKIRGLMAAAQSPPSPPSPGLPGPGGVPLPPPPSPGDQARMILGGMTQAGVDPRSMMMPQEVTQQILYVWARMAQQAQAPDFTQIPFTQFMAVVRGHRLLGEGKKAMAMGSPTMAAPGGSSTTAGTEPVLGSTATPGQGTPSEAAGLPAGATPAQG